jgi:3-dehydroquinate synthase class II
MLLVEVSGGVGGGNVNGGTTADEQSVAERAWRGSVILQNAETVRLVGWPRDRGDMQSGKGEGAGTSSRNTIVSQEAETGKALAQVGGAGVGRCDWSGMSVASLRPGDVVLVHRPPGSAARHTGIAIEEWVLER